MKPVARVQFRIADFMILLAGITVGLALIGKDGPSTITNLIWVFGNYFTDPNFVSNNAVMFPWIQLEYVVAFALPLLAGLTMSLAMIRLMHTGSRRARLAREPGAMACLVASAALILEFGTAAVFYSVVKTGWTSQTGGVWAYVLGLDGFRRVASRVSFAVGAAWLVLAIGGRWRAEPTWIDRAGRVVGISWLALIPLYNWAILR